MNAPSPNIEQYEKLWPIAERLYQHTDQLAQIMLLPLFLLSIVFAYSSDLGIQGAIVSRVKRLVITALLLAAFPSLSNLIKSVGQEIALSIDNLQGLDEFLKAASDKASSYSGNVTSLLEFGNDLLVSFFVTASFLILYFARYLLVAFYHFYWLVLVVTAPLLILGHLFESSAQLPKNLFKNMLLVSCWPVVWSILSAFLKALPYMDAYKLEGGYTTIIVMNLILAVSLLFSPFLLSQFCEGLIVGSGSAVYGAGKAVVSMIAPKAAFVASRAGEKVYPILQKQVINRIGSIRSMSQLTRNNTMKAIFFALAFAASTASANEQINVRLGLSTVLCFERLPEHVAIGDSKHFQAQRVGNTLLLRSLNEDQESNLLVFFRNGLPETYKLSSNNILPHRDLVNCKAQEAPVTPKQVVPLARTAQKGLSVALQEAKWNSDAKDYLTLIVGLANNSSDEWKPKWAKVELTVAGKTVGHTKLWSSRQSIPRGSRAKAVIEFTRAGIKTGDLLALKIPSNQDTLSLQIKGGI